MVQIAVLGCGLMGTKIAGCMAYHGHKVRVYDANSSALGALHSNLEADKKELKEEGLMIHPNFLGQVLCISRLEEAVCDAEYIFEAVIEDLEVKQSLIREVSHLCSTDAIISTNTLNLDIREIAVKAAYPETVVESMCCIRKLLKECRITPDRFTQLIKRCKDIPDKTPIRKWQRVLGLRFLHPVYAVPEVEINPTAFTAQKCVEKVRQFLEAIGKTLFFRSGTEALILSPEQINSRKLARRQQLLRQHGMLGIPDRGMPHLGHSGNLTPPQDDECAAVADRDCAICMDRPRDCLLCPCHHLVTCHDCAKSLMNRRDYCPICRKEITETIRVYTS